MPLHEDNSTLSSFRELKFFPATIVKRSTSGRPASSEELTNSFLKKFDFAKAITDLRDILSENWGMCVGANIADKCRPQNVRLNVLYVYAANSTVKQELIFEEKAILKKVRTLSGCAKIRRIRVI